MQTFHKMWITCHLLTAIALNKRFTKRIILSLIIYKIGIKEDRGLYE